MWSEGWCVCGICGVRAGGVCGICGVRAGGVCATD